jgi:SAM-dependent methyltransferase
LPELPCDRIGRVATQVATGYFAPATCIAPFLPPGQRKKSPAASIAAIATPREIVLSDRERNPRVPVKPAIAEPERGADTIDWDSVSADYHHWIISPWAPEMTAPEPDRGGTPRNRLLAAIDAYASEDLRTRSMLDYGCGPGNMLKFLEGRIDEISGLDLSPAALEICGRLAARAGIRFHAIAADMRDYVSEFQFDLIVSCNAVLPARREDIARTFRCMERNLKPDGTLMMILPSYDTCLALLAYTAERDARLSADDHEAVDRRIAAFRAEKKMDDVTLSFADDGVHAQCFHTPQSIHNELAVAGFRVETMEKVEYPWEYAKRFDYGYYPDRPEIWDWYVEATKV